VEVDHYFLARREQTLQSMEQFLHACSKLDMRVGRHHEGASVASGKLRFTALLPSPEHQVHERCRLNGPLNMVNCSLVVHTNYSIHAGIMVVFLDHVLLSRRDTMSATMTSASFQGESFYQMVRKNVCTTSCCQCSITTLFFELYAVAEIAVELNQAVLSASFGNRYVPLFRSNRGQLLSIKYVEKH